MRVWIYHGNTDIRPEELPEPQPGPGEVAVRIAYNGLCGSDLHEYFDGTHGGGYVTRTYGCSAEEFAATLELINDPDSVAPLITTTLAVDRPVAIEALRGLGDEITLEIDQHARHCAHARQRTLRKP